jgi:glutaconate CoA-transferase subunit A
MRQARISVDKLVPLAEAVANLPVGPLRLALGGVTLYRRPMAFVLALLDQFETGGRERRIELVCFTASLESDILVGAGLVGRIRTCYFGLEIFGLAPFFTAAAAKGDLEIVDESETSLAAGLRAKLAGVGFMPSKAWLGTDMPTLRPDVQSVTDPYSGESLTAFPAIDLDVAVVHALEADRLGNAMIGGNRGVDVELALAADQVIVTADRIVSELDQADLVGPVVDWVVEAPGGAWPTSCHPLYPMDGLAVLAYTEAVGTVVYPDLIHNWKTRHGILHL